MCSQIGLELCFSSITLAGYSVTNCVMENGHKIQIFSSIHVLKSFGGCSCLQPSENRSIQPFLPSAKAKPAAYSTQHQLPNHHLEAFCASLGSLKPFAMLKCSVSPPVLSDFLWEAFVRTIDIRERIRAL